MKTTAAALFLACLTQSFSLSAHSQVTIGDTLRVMSYNLTNYGNAISGCTNANNGPTLKNPEFKNIMKHVMPDILGVCEMNTNPLYATNFLTNVLNTDGVTYYKKSNAQPEPAGTITSVLYFNGNKLTLKNQSYAPSNTRLTHHFRLYLNTDELVTGDTIWINVMAGHLKAGTATSDATDRTNMTITIRNYLNTFSKKENFMIMGDFNTYRSSEGAFVNLTAALPNPTYQFIDPVNRVGSWTNNGSYADVHTQCPSLTSNGCFSGGGLDDRFDFILMNRHLINDSAKLKYIPGTYKPLGNDGQHFNKNITDNPTNTSVPASVLLSLYKASDHLPVVAKLYVEGTFVTSVNTVQKKQEVFGHFENNKLILTGIPDGKSCVLHLLSMEGREVWGGKVMVEDSRVEIETSTLKNGLYVCKGWVVNGSPVYLKVLKND